MTRTASDGPALIVGDKGDESGIEDGTSRLPPQDDGLFIVIETLTGQAAKILEGIPVAADEREEVSLQGKIDIVPSGKGQDVGKTQDGCFPPLLEVDGIGATVHLPLDAGIRLKANDGVAFGFPAKRPQAAPKDRDATPIAGFPQFLEEAHPGNVWVGGEEFLDPWQEGVELASSGQFRNQQAVAAISAGLVLAHDAPNGVAADLEIAAKGAHGPPLGMHGNQEMLHLLAVSNIERRHLSPLKKAS